MSGQWLAIADADRIQQYVFSPNSLRLIRGGSALQAELNMRELRQLVTDQEKIYEGGGTVLAKFRDAESAEAFCIRAETIFREKTTIATVSTAKVAYTGDFASARKLLGQLLEMKKGARAFASFNGRSPWQVSCSACGLYAAVSYDQVENRPACRACEQRADWSERSSYYPTGVKPPKDFRSIGEKSVPENYLAIVYIDLDRLGRYLDDHGQCEEDFARLADRIRLAVQHGIRNTLEGMLIKEGRSYYEILLLGGDDAVVALPANYVFRFLSGFQESYRAWFSNNCRAPGDRPDEPVPSFSAGIVIAHDHFPITDSLRHAKDLLRSAKSLGRGPAKEDSADYLILSGPLGGSVVEQRARARGGEPSRTLKPYTLGNLSNLVDALQKMKAAGVPASKIRPLYNVTYSSLEQAELDYLWVLSRLEPRHRKLLRKAIEGSELTWSFWRRGPGGGSIPRTNGADLAELWEFVDESNTFD